MKKHTLLIAIGGFLLIVGLLLPSGKKQEVIYYYETKLSLDEATALIQEKIINIMELYEKPEATFGVSTEVVENKKEEKEETKEEEKEETKEEEDTSTTDTTATAPEEKVEDDTKEEKEYFKAKNYDSVIDNLYTEKGKEELENIKFGDKQFVDKKDDGVYILLELPERNRFSNNSITIANLTIKDDIIKGIVSFTSDELNDKDVLTYYVYEKNITLVKQDDKWLIDSFIYSNI